MLEFKINFINGVQLQHRNIEELLSAADLEHVPGVNYVTSVAVQDASESYANWYRGQIYDRYMSPRDAFDSLFEMMLDLLDSDVYFLDEVAAAQTQIRGRHYQPDITDAIDPEDLKDMDDIAADPLSPQEEQRIWEKFEREFSQDPAELDPAELWKGFGI